MLITFLVVDRDSVVVHDSIQNTVFIIPLLSWGLGVGHIDCNAHACMMTDGASFCLFTAVHFMIHLLILAIFVMFLSWCLSFSLVWQHFRPAHVLTLHNDDNNERDSIVKLLNVNSPKLLSHWLMNDFSFWFLIHVFSFMSFNSELRSSSLHQLKIFWYLIFTV